MRSFNVKSYPRTPTTTPNWVDLMQPFQPFAPSSTFSVPQGALSRHLLSPYPQKRCISEPDNVRQGLYSAERDGVSADTIWTIPRLTLANGHHADHLLQNYPVDLSSLTTTSRTTINGDIGWFLTKPRQGVGYLAGREERNAGSAFPMPWRPPPAVRVSDLDLCMDAKAASVPGFSDERLLEMLMGTGTTTRAKTRLRD